MSSKRTLVACAAALAALGLATYAVAAGQVTAVDSYTGCLKNSKLDSIALGSTPSASCGTGQIVHLSGGDITSVPVRTGLGLLGGADSGDVELGIDPTVSQNRVTGSCLGNPILPTDASIGAVHEDGTVTCNHDDVGPSTDVHAGFWDGPVPMPQGYVSPKPIAELTVPAGKYAISATLDVSIDDGTDAVACKLVAGADFDKTTLFLQGIGDGARLALNVVHEFTVPAAVHIDCGHLFDQPVDWSFLKITAIRVAGLSNGPLTLLP